jgi:hypothetical protein
MSVIFNRQSGYARTIEKLQSDLARVQATDTGCCDPKQFQDVIEPAKMTFPPAFTGF